MKSIDQLKIEIEQAKKYRDYEKDRLYRMVKEFGFIESGIWIPGHKMRDFDLFNGYLPNQIYKVMRNSYPDSFVFYATYFATENAFFDIECYENSKFIDIDGMIAMPIFINFEKKNS